TLGKRGGGVNLRPTSRPVGAWRARSARTTVMARGTGIVLDERMLGHDPGRGHPERPDRLRVLCDNLRDRPDLVRIGARPASEDGLARVHGPGPGEGLAPTAGHPCVGFR